MTTYAIGDLQGCLQPLQKLLSLIGFSASRDTLLFCGDLINRGPESLATLRFVKHLVEQGSAKTVLGNHDIHLLCVDAGYGSVKKSDTLNDILAAKDRQTLIHWLAQQPLTQTQPSSILAANTCAWVSHAGLYPQWTTEQADALANEFTDALRAPHHHSLLAGLYGNTPSAWNSALSGIDRLRFIVNALTRMRFVTASGALVLKLKLALDNTPPLANAKPWFHWLTPHQTNQKRIIFGHWSTLNGSCEHPAVEAIDTGYVWGGALTAIDLKTFARYTVQNQSSLGHHATPFSA